LASNFYDVRSDCVAAMTRALRVDAALLADERWTWRGCVLSLNSAVAYDEL
jgi:hypothetical protein